VRPNIEGTQNVIDAALDARVERVIGLSTDKASSPVNLYGATKLVADKLLVAGNAFVERGGCRFSVVRYGNVMGSRGSVVERFRSLGRDGKLPITDTRMTRFWITLRQGVDFVRESLVRMRGGEIFVPKLPSIKLVDLAAAIVPEAELEIVGPRPGEKLHEELISETDARHCLELDSYYRIEPETLWWSGDGLAGEPVPDGFSFSSDSNDRWLGIEDLRAMLETPCES
jgi:UDP-N-acetylglucosamine 4,6-dehydratase